MSHTRTDSTPLRLRAFSTSVDATVNTLLDTEDGRKCLIFVDDYEFATCLCVLARQVDKVISLPNVRGEWLWFVPSVILHIL